MRFVPISERMPTKCGNYFVKDSRGRLGVCLASHDLANNIGFDVPAFVLNAKQGHTASGYVYSWLDESPDCEILPRTSTNTLKPLPVDVLQEMVAEMKESNRLLRETLESQKVKEKEVYLVVSSNNVALKVFDELEQAKKYAEGLYALQPTIKPITYIR